MCSIGSVVLFFFFFLNGANVSECLHNVTFVTPNAILRSRHGLPVRILEAAIPLAR